MSDLKARSALSIANMLSREQKQQKNAEGKEQPDLRENFTSEDLARIWDGLCREAATGKRIGLHTAMNAADVRPGADFTIEIAVSSAAAAHELEENMLELLARLRSGLRNTALTHRITVDESVRERLPYTPREKYEYFRLKNPLIEKMRGELDLNIDF